MKNDLTLNDLKQRLSYHPQTGEFIWLINRGRARVGSNAGNMDRYGYSNIRIDGSKFKAHRLAWLFTYGEWPDGEIDHRNRDRADNRISNLRLCTRRQNMVNCGVRSDSGVGLRGVGRLPCGYRASIRYKGVSHHIGVFKNADEAHAAYMKANRDLNGEFASC